MVKKGVKWKLGRKKVEYTDELRKKFSDLHRGKTLSLATKARLRARSLENWKNPEYRKKVIRSGWHFSEEVKKRMSDLRKGKKPACSHLGLKHSIEARKKISDAHKGKSQTDERKKNTSIAITEWWKKRKASYGIV